MVVSLRYAVPVALAIAGVLLPPLLRAGEAASVRQAGVRAAGQMQPASVPNEASVAVARAAAAGVPQSLDCISDWSEAGPIVRREGLATMERVGRLASDKASLEIVTSALCQSDSGYVYRLRVRGGHDGGKAALKTLFVDARQPFGP
jgi:hypothetical protein